jgi:hypothetical protein
VFHEIVSTPLLRISSSLVLILLLALGCAGRQAPEPPHESPPSRGLSSFDFIYNGASVDTTPPADQELRPPVIAEELALPLYPPEALSGGADPATVAVRILVDNEGRVAEVADSPRLPSTPGPFAPHFRRSVEDVLDSWKFWPAQWRRYEPGEDLDGDGVADYRRVVESRVVTFYLDVRFDFEIVDGRGRVRSDHS